MHKKIGRDRACGSGDVLAARQTKSYKVSRTTKTVVSQSLIGSDDLSISAISGILNNLHLMWTF